MKTIAKIKIVLIALIISFTTMLQAQVKVQEDIPEKLYEEYQQKGIDEALKTYEQNNTENNYDFRSEPLNVLGYRLMSEGNLDAAEKVFLAQIDEYPDQPNPYDSYADLLKEKGEMEKAVSNYEKAILITENIEDLEEQQEIFEASTSKIAKIAGKGLDFKFLVGNWKIERYDYKNGEKSPPRGGSLTYSSNEDGSILSGVTISASGNYQGTRILAYDAVKEEYDMAQVSNSLSGIKTSDLQIEKSSPEELVMLETFDKEGDKVTVKHVIKKSGQNIKWQTYTMADGKQGELVNETDYTKKN